MANAGNIRAWLAELGLAKYAEAFSSNAIDLDLVREMTEADLKDLGVEAMGDRKRLLRAIASLATAKASSVAGTMEGQPPADAERRQITVLFCDLVGSTHTFLRLGLAPLSTLAMPAPSAAAPCITISRASFPRVACP
jgi:hypothetical protein